MIIDAAVEASRGTGLESWSLRDLARRLNVAPSAVYHHVGGKDLLRHHVVERVLGMVDLPRDVRPWREWFRAALYPIRPVLATYPGTARWLLMHGPAFASVAPVVDAGIASLDDAGFGRESARVFASLFNTALMTIAAADDRMHHEDEKVRDHARVMAEFTKASGDSVGVSRMAHDMAAWFTGSPESVAAARDEYYRFVLERLMDGLEGTLSENQI
jgi:AcrR family transcriptional regulator